ncbi:hypothetical protein [Streptomyces sp. NPDC059468]|uniref:hypothetical protein n=1 Tax=Streptomyces sp. NPDC059468 TaxID=3346845 RepID=UPI0036B095AF
MWRMRYYLKKDPGQKKSENYATDLTSAQEAARAVENALLIGVARVDIVSPDYEPDREPVLAQEIAWVRQEHPTGEHWIGRIAGKKVADVFAPQGGRTRAAQYSVFLGALGPEYVDVTNVESGKRAAQRAVNKVVQALVGGD